MTITTSAPTLTLERPPLQVPRSGEVARLLVRCPDQRGAVAAIGTFLSQWGAETISLDQHTTDCRTGELFQRTEFHLPEFSARRERFEEDFQRNVAATWQMTWSLASATTPKRIAIMASKRDHCLVDLLWRARRKESPFSVGMVISNHPDLEEQVRSFGFPFVHIPVARDRKAEAEARQLEQLHREHFDLVVLARYMQILSAEFVDAVGCPIINIHHSFLPAFIGADPYRRAKDRGVKLVGATAHYVTKDLDEGPIIEQDVARVTHRASLDDVVRLGAEVERSVLSRAVQWHCEDRVIRHGNSTIVF
ncbi:formyltetrahydrofolate deformylase [Mycobacterium heidelbergense]|uniref:formyltetrahydrofolate deformylase n=1 Tax=Mycobacterium heidelbergense TaxID=53376 RepID=UPI003CF2D053